MAQHVRMSFDAKFGVGPSALDHPRDPAAVRGAPLSETKTNGEAGVRARVVARRKKPRRDPGLEALTRSLAGCEAAMSKKAERAL
jgi:hypothetical protein